MNKEKEKIEQQQNKQSCQTRSLGAAQTTVGQRGAGQRNESSMESQSQGNDPQSQFYQYQRGTNMLQQSANMNMNKRTDQTGSLPQSQEQPPRAKKYR